MHPLANSVTATTIFDVYIHALCVGVGGFLPAVKQIANVAALPGIVGVRQPIFQRLKILHECKTRT